MATFALSGVDLRTEKCVVDEIGSVQVHLPEKSLSAQSLQVETRNSQKYNDWSKDDSSSAHQLLRKIIYTWKQKEIAEQYLIYGKQHLDEPFHWEIVPYHKSSMIFGRIWQQFQVLWRVTFGGTTTSNEALQKKQSEYNKALTDSTALFDQQVKKVAEVAKSDDAFCNPSVIEKQKVFEGKEVNVLYNYAPIGFGGERLHFLIVPKQHRTTFEEITKEEYLESMDLAKRMITHFSDKRQIQSAYLYHKTGVDAGQTVPHWHTHLVLTTNNTQDFLGKLTVLKNMLFGSFPLKGKKLEASVEKYKTELGKCL
ncbi:MAG: hypothetical protein K940chlam6_01187 [Chlamydiae bacterium]|nr:hypothetical protein [Chlamydiota bacterium]